MGFKCLEIPLDEARVLPIRDMKHQFRGCLWECPLPHTAQPGIQQLGGPIDPTLVTFLKATTRLWSCPVNPTAVKEAIFRLVADLYKVRLSIVLPKRCNRNSTVLIHLGH